MAERDSDDSDAPEEFTAQQAIEVDEGIQKVQKENKTRVARERKERQRLWAQRKTPRPSKDNKRKKELAESEPNNEEQHEEEQDEKEMAKNGMLSKNIVNLLAAREKQVFLSDSEEEKVVEKPEMSKKKRKSTGYRAETVILNEISHASCLQSSLEFLKKKKMQVPRSTAVLKNSNQALRLISSPGLLGMK